MGVLNSKLNSDQPEEFFRFTNGIDLDQRLWKQELQVQRVWLDAIAELGVLSLSEHEALTQGLSEIHIKMESGEFIWSFRDEDIHMNIESYLTEKFGEAGKKIHLGRSRNDLIATTLRLFVRDCLESNRQCLVKLAHELVEQSNSSIDVIVPAMTHRQNAQPIRLSHIWLHFGFSFCRDLGRIVSAEKTAMGQMPLGSAAICGSTLSLDLDALARKLGFESGPWSAYDGVSSRDFILDALMVYSGTALQVTRFCEDLIYWSSTPVRLLNLPRAWSSGSSIMPNKRNPDIPELVRARCSQVIGKSFEAQCLMKGLPSGYSSDLHELKRVFIEAHQLLHSSLEVLTEFLRCVTISKSKAERLLEDGHLLATDVANSFVEGGMSFREAYKKTAALVERAEAKGIQIHDLSEMSVTMERAVESRNCAGGTSRKRTMESIEKLKKEIRRNEADSSC